MHWGVAHPVTFQHAQVHGIIGSLGHTEHHLEAVLYLPFSFLTACEQLLEKINTMTAQCSASNILADIQESMKTHSARGIK